MMIILYGYVFFFYFIITFSIFLFFTASIFICGYILYGYVFFFLVIITFSYREDPLYLLYCVVSRHSYCEYLFLFEVVQSAFFDDGQQGPYYCTIIITIIILQYYTVCNFSIVNSFIFKHFIKYRQSSGKFSLQFHHFQHFQPKF